MFHWTKVSELKTYLETLNHEFQSYRESTDKKIAIMEKEIQLLKARETQIENQSPLDDPIVTESKHSDGNKEAENEQKHSKHYITYDQALQCTGGEEKIQEYHDFCQEQLSRISSLNQEKELQKMMNHIAMRKGYSLKSVNQPAECAECLNSLYEYADKVYPIFKEKLLGLEKITGGSAIIAPLKGKERALMKALFKYRDGTPNGIAWHRLTDIVRATIQFENIDKMYSGLQVIIDYFGKENVVEFNDRYQKPFQGGYRDLQLSIKVDNFVCELQLNTQAMLQAKETTGHRSYEVARELKAAVQEGDHERVKKTLQFGLDTMGSSGEGFDLKNDKMGLLLTAARNGHSSILLELIRNGSDVNAQNKDGNTALHLAVLNGYETCVWILLDAGKADVNVLNGDGLTALALGYMELWTQPPEETTRAIITLASNVDYKLIVEAVDMANTFRSKKLKNREELVNHAQNGDCEKLQEDLKEHGDPDSTNSSNESAIEMATKNHHAAAVELLIKYGASVKTRDECNESHSLLYWALASDQHEFSSVDCAKTVQTLILGNAPIENDVTRIIIKLFEAIEQSTLEESDEAMEYVNSKFAYYGFNIATMRSIKQNLSYSSNKLIGINGRNHIFTKKPQLMNKCWTVSTFIKVNKLQHPRLPSELQPGFQQPSYAFHRNTNVSQQQNHERVHKMMKQMQMRDKWYAENPPYHFIRWNQKSVIRFTDYGQLKYVGLDGKESIEVVSNENILEEDKWYHIAVTSSINEVSLYLDGKKVGETKLTNDAQVESEDMTSKTNQTDYEISSCFLGEIQGLSLFNQCLPDNEVSLLSIN